MASCAVCLSPIVRGQRFVLDGTEVLHATCVSQSYRSKLRITEAKMRELEQQVVDTRRAAARVELDAHQLRNDATSAQAQVAVLEGRVAAERSRREMLLQRHEATEDELRAAQRQVAALRAELQALKPSTEEQKDDIDASVQRFKMLELD